MKTSDLSAFIKEHLLEGTSHGRNVYALGCGCLVIPDGDYLDLYVWDNGERRCDETGGHYMVNLVGRWLTSADPDADLSSEDLAEIVTMITKYTEGWGEQADLLERAKEWEGGR